MKKLFIICFLGLALNAFSQTEKELRDYLSQNVKSLNPIEGIYDVEWYCRYITPFVDQTYGTYSATIIITKGSENSYDVFLSSGYGKGAYEYRIASNINIYQIGETNVYNFVYYSSKCRIYLTDMGTHFQAQLALNHSSANKLVPWMDLAPSVNIYPVWDCIKTYPTPSMYRN